MLLEDLLQKIPYLAVDAVCITRREEGDEDARICWVNDAFCKTYRLSREAALGSDPLKYLHWDYVEDLREGLQEMVEAGLNTFRRDTLCLRSDGSSFWGSLALVFVQDDDGGGRYGIQILRDIDDLKNREQSAELALIENEHLLSKIEAVQTRLMSAISISPDPFAIYDSRDRLVIWNPAFADTVSPNNDDIQAGMTKREVAVTCLKNGHLDDAVGREEEFLKSYMSEWDADEMTGFVMRVKGRDYKVIRSRGPNGDRVALHVDISEQLRQQRELSTYAKRLEQANREISQQALQDELTGLGNRRFLNARLEEMIEARQESGPEIAALHIDLDRFKQINDTMGHAAGDHVLRRRSS